MDLRTERTGAALVAFPEGRIDSSAATSFYEAMTAVIDDGDDRVIVDCSDVVFVSSAGLRALLMVAKSVNPRATFSLCSIRPSVRQVFDVSGFSRILTIHASREEALAR